MESCVLKYTTKKYYYTLQIKNRFYVQTFIKFETLRGSIVAIFVRGKDAEKLFCILLHQ